MAASEYYYGTAAAQQMGDGRMGRPAPHGSGTNLAQMGRPHGSGASLMQMGRPHGSGSSLMQMGGHASNANLSQMGHPYHSSPNLMHPQPQYPQQQHLVSQRPAQEMYSSSPPPAYTSYQAPQPQPPQPHAPPAGYQQQPDTYSPQPKPYPASGPTSYPAQPQRRQTYRPQHGGLQIRPTRSRSQPPRVRFAGYDSDSPLQSDSSDGNSPRKRHRHRKHRHSHSEGHHHGRSSSSSDSLGRDYDSDRPRSQHHHRRHNESATHQKERTKRDTLIGASAGGLIGDAIFPGLGTVGGLLLGGYGGRKHAKKRRSESGGELSREDEWARDGHWHHPRSSREDGWDEESATFKKGHAIR